MKDLVNSKQFKKDFKRVTKRGWNLKKMFGVIEFLRNDRLLDKKHKIHKLTGDYSEFMECHIEPDWLLVYKTDEKRVSLYRTGSHSDLF